MYLKYDHKDKIFRNQTIKQFQLFGYLLDTHFKLLIFQNKSHVIGEGL